MKLLINNLELLAGRTNPIIPEVVLQFRHKFYISELADDTDMLVAQKINTVLLTEFIVPLQVNNEILNKACKLRVAEKAISFTDCIDIETARYENALLITPEKLVMDIAIQNHVRVFPVHLMHRWLENQGKKMSATFEISPGNNCNIRLYPLNTRPLKRKVI